MCLSPSSRLPVMFKLPARISLKTCAIHSSGSGFGSALSKTSRVDDLSEAVTNVDSQTNSDSAAFIPEVDIVTGTGRRKCAVAQVELRKGRNSIRINNKTLAQHMQQNIFLISTVMQPLQEVNLKNLDIKVQVYGGGLVAQSEAIRLGLCRALCKCSKQFRRSYKLLGFLTRDARVKERKKYGLKKARKASQYSKR